jgi:hypothetical protein
LSLAGLPNFAQLLTVQQKLQVQTSLAHALGRLQPQNKHVDCLCAFFGLLFVLQWSLSNLIYNSTGSKLERYCGIVMGPMPMQDRNNIYS